MARGCRCAHSPQSGKGQKMTRAKGPWIGIFLVEQPQLSRAFLQPGWGSGLDPDILGYRESTPNTGSAPLQGEPHSCSTSSYLGYYPVTTTNSTFIAQFVAQKARWMTSLHPAWVSLGWGDAGSHVLHPTIETPAGRERSPSGSGRILALHKLGYEYQLLEKTWRHILAVATLLATVKVPPPPPPVAHSHATWTPLSRQGRSWLRPGGASGGARLGLS